MRPLAQSDAHDGPWLIDEAVPGEAALVEDIVAGFEDAVRQPVSRLNCQTFSTGLRSGHFGGSGSRVMLAGMTSPAERCQPAWSRISTA